MAGRRGRKAWSEGVLAGIAGFFEMVVRAPMVGACQLVALLQSLTVLGKLDVEWPAVVGKLVLSPAVQSRCT